MPVDAGGGTGARAPSPPKETKAQVWWFQGKAYFSWAGYQAAVAAAQEAARVAATRAARLSARQAAEQRELQQRQAARVRNARRLAELAEAQRRARLASASMRAESRRRSEMLQLKQDAARRAREQQLIIRRREMEKRAAEQQRILQRQTQLQRVKNERRAAWDQLQERESAIWQAYRRQQAVSVQRTVATRQIQKESQTTIRFNPRGGLFEGVEPGSVHRGEEVIRRQKALDHAKETGDWSQAIDILDDQSKRTGGRYVDPDLYEAINQQLVSPVVALGTAYNEKISEINDLIEADSWEEALSLWETPAFERLREEYIRWYGDPSTGKKGKFERLAKRLDSIAERNEKVWVRQMAGLPPEASDAEVAEVIRKGYEAAPKDVRGGFAQWADGRNPRMDLYMEMLDSKRKRDIQRLKSEMQRTLKLTRQEGYVNARFEEGRFFYDRPEDLKIMKDLEAVLPNAGSRLAAIEAAQANPAQREQMIRQFMSDAAAAYDQNRDRFTPYLDRVGQMAVDRVSGVAPVGGLRGYSSSGVGGGAAGAEYQRMRSQFLSQIATTAFGRPWTALDQLSTTGPGAALQGAFALFSTVPAAVRFAFQQKSGNFSPYVDLHLFGEKGLGFEIGRVKDENADAARAAFEKALETGDVGVIAEAIRQYSQWGEGNLGGLLTQATDPLQFAGLGSFTKPGGMALARAGGLRAAAAQPGALLADYFRLARPKRLLGGAGRDAVKVEFARIKIAQGLGINYKSVMNEADDVWRELTERFVRGDQALKLSEDLTRFLEKSPLNGDQLMSQAQNVIRRVAKEYGLQPATALRVNRLIRAAREGIEHATKQADAAAALTRQRAKQQALRATLQTVRQRMPSGPLPARRLTAAQVAEHNVRLQRYVGATQDYLSIAQRASALADEIQSLGAVAKPDYKRLRAATGELRQAVREMKRFDDQLVTGGGRLIGRRGKVGRYWNEVVAWRKQIGGDPTGPSLPDLKAARLRADKKWLVSRIKGVKASIAVEKDPQKLAGLKRMLREAEDARAGLEFEFSALSNRKVARAYAQQNRDRISKAVRPQQLGARATSHVQRRVETSRALSNRLGQVEKTARAPRISARSQKIVDDTIAAMEQIDVAALLRSFGFDWGDDINMLDLLQSLNKVMDIPEVRMEYIQLYNSLVKRARNVLMQAGGRSGDVEMFLDQLPWQHVRKGAAPLDLKAYRALDRRVTDAIVNQRGFRAEGQIRRGAKTKGRPRSGALLRADTDPLTVLAKVKALRGAGVDLHQYDAARGVLGDIMLQRGRMANLLREARQIAATSGEKLDDVFLRLREERAVRESMREFEEWATRPEMQGLTPEQILKVFEEDYITRDLGILPGLTLTEYQVATLRRAWEAEAGFDFDDAVLKARWLGGHDVARAGTRVALPSDLPGDFLTEFPDAPVYIVDDPVLADQLIGSGNLAKALGPEGIFVRPGATAATVWHEAFHLFQALPANEALVRSLSASLSRAKMTFPAWGKALGRRIDDVDELMAELWGLERAGQLDQFYVGLSQEAQLAVDSFLAQTRGLKPVLRDAFAYGPHVPPLSNRGKMRTWLVDNGYWSPRTGDQIASGERVWSVKEERAFFERNWGYSPPWTDETLLTPLLNDQAAFSAALSEWGFDDNGFERIIAERGMAPKEVQNALAWGSGEVKRARTWSELRRWATGRYGDLVMNGTQFKRMPWLMRADDEYLDWLGASLSQVDEVAYRAAREAEWQAAKDRLPKAIVDAYFDGDVLQRAGLQLDRGLVKASEVASLNEAIVKATRRRLERMKKVGDLEPGLWLHQEQMRFAYEVVNELLVDRGWRSLLSGTPVMGAGLHLWGQFWRALVSWQPAFPIMNLIDTYGLKRIYLQVYQNGFRPLGWDKDGSALVASLREIGAESTSIFHLQHGAQSFTDFVGRVGDQSLSLNVRGGAFIEGLSKTPVLISKWGEDRLRLQFARSVAGDTYRAAQRTGMDATAAEWLARAEAKRLVNAFFATAPNSGWRKALDELVPFFNYNWRNKTLALRMLGEHPSVWIWGERVRREIEKANREWWAEEHPNLPFPEGPSAGSVWFEVDGEIYQIDLSSFSDWSRALKNVSGDQNAVEWFTEFVRVPHPSQLGLLSAFTGEMTPWGRPGGLRELSFWVDLLYWVNGKDYANPDWRRDLIQMGSQMLFFKRFGKISREKIMQMTYFNLRDLDEAAAQKYLDEHPDLLAYWAAKGAGSEVDPSNGVHRYSLLSSEERTLFSASMEEFERLNNRLDADILKYVNQPWSEEYKAAKKQAWQVRQLFLSQHPEIVDYLSLHLSPAQFAEYFAGWKTDEEVEAFFSLKRPSASDFKTPLEYQQALVKFYEQREQYLEDHPSVKRALYEGRTAIERAWHDQELHWSEILEMQARIKVRILQEEMQGAAADRDLIGTLYDLRNDAGLALDAARYEVFDSIVAWGDEKEMRRFNREFRRAVTGEGGTLLQRLGQIPGFGSFIFDRATPEEKQEIRRNEWYARSIGEIVQKATDGKSFYDLLRQNPALLQEYWRRNPDAKARYLAGQEYFRWITSWVSHLKRDDFVSAQSVWDSMPAWVKERYFAGHPESGMIDGVVGGGSRSAVQYRGQWFKSPQSRDRYIYFIEQGGEGPVPKGLDLKNTSRFSSPEARMRFVRGQEYYAALGGWIKLLEDDRFEEADAYFRRLPEWMRDKYFTKHPDQRAKMELDSAALRAGAEYFLARGDDKLKVLQRNPALRAWLNEHGGDEASHFGLINAIYRAIPTDEPWLKRTFRERFPEVFSQAAAGERRLSSVARDLAENPDVLPFYEKAVRLQYAIYQKQLQLNEEPPDPWTMDRVRRHKKRRKRRAARWHSRFSLYREIRRHPPEVAGRQRTRP